jgi:hypothetical protein
MLVGVSRNGQAPQQPLADFRFEAGDSAIVEVNDAFFYENRRETDFILTKRLEGFLVQRIDRALIASAITVAMIALAAFGVMSMLNAALLATFAMLLTGCLTIQRAWQSLEWKTLVVLGAAVGLESAVTGSGLAKAAADLFAAIGGDSPLIALAAVFIGTVLLTNIISNGSHVFGSGVFGYKPERELPPVRDDPDVCGVVCVHQPGRLPDQSDGPGTRWIYVWRLRKSGLASHYSGRRGGSLAGADCLRLLGEGRNSGVPRRDNSTI